MESRRRFMPLLTELGGWKIDFCYKHVAPNSAPASALAFQQSHRRCSFLQDQPAGFSISLRSMRTAYLSGPMDPPQRLA
jgi:hypothetical protein